MAFFLLANLIIIRQWKRKTDKWIILIKIFIQSTRHCNAIQANNHPNFYPTESMVEMQHIYKYNSFLLYKSTCYFKTETRPKKWLHCPLEVSIQNFITIIFIKKYWKIAGQIDTQSQLSRVNKPLDKGNELGVTLLI